MANQRKRAEEGRKRPEGHGGEANGIDRRVRAVVARVMNADADGMDPEMRFVEDLQADSLRVMELVLELQEEFGIDIPDEALERIRSVGDAIRYVRERLSG